MKLTKAVKDQVKVSEIYHELKMRHPRYALLWKIGIFTGLRIGDLLEIKVSDIIPEYLTVKEQKTGNVRSVKLNQDILDDAFSLIDDYDLDRNEYLFFRRYTDRVHHISRQWIHCMISRIAHERGLDSIGAHSMRKTYACQLLHKERSIEAVREALGHKYQGTTMAYLADLLES